MDLKNFEATTTYAIEAVYNEYWRCIPEKYRLLQKMDVEQNPPSPDEPKPKSKPLTYKKAEESKDEYEGGLDTYDHYVDMLNSGQYIDLAPFYDPALDFENRLHNKLVGIDYPDRKKPWFVITWNMGNGLLKSSLTRRRFETCEDTTPGGEKVVFDFINTDLDLTFAIYSNSMQALIELQENIIISKREKCVVNTRTHSVLGKFPVSLDIIDSSVAKLPRDKSTLCVLTLNVKIDYPVIGNVRPSAGLIKEFHVEYDSKVYTDADSSLSLETEIIPDSHVVLARDIINEES